MCDQVVGQLPAEPRSARRARDLVASSCVEWALGDLCADVVLPVSELATNAILHARTDLTVAISLTEQFIEVAVRDKHPRPPIMRPVRLDLDRDLDALGSDPGFPADLRDSALHVGQAGSIAAGRGLHIVDAVADEWGVAEYAGGKDVWFRITTPTGWQPRVPCGCTTGETTTPGGLRLTVSGAYR